jgi:hypothetical protein
MTGKQQEPSETQRTEKGIEIPVPKRGEVFAALRKLVQPVKKG